MYKDYVMWNDGTKLYHYGIPGQKWGVKNGPPYPLGTEQKSGKERKKTYRDKQYEKRIQKSRQKINPDTLKTLAKVGLTAAAAYMAYKYVTNPGTNIGRIVNIYEEWHAEDETFSDLEALHKAIKKVDTDFFDKVYVSEFEKNHPDEWKALQESFGKDDIEYNSTMLSLFGSGDYYNDFFNSDEYSDETWAKLVKDLNPGWPKSKEISNNCMLCTMAMVMRLKGYDPQAALSGMGWHDEMLSSWWGDDIETVSFNSYLADKNTVIDTILSKGDNHYGNFTLQWETGGGHSIMYAVKNGEVHFIDGQCGREYNTDELFKNIVVGASTFTDLTNAQPTPRLAAGILSKEDRSDKKITANYSIGIISEIYNALANDSNQKFSDVVLDSNMYKKPPRDKKEIEKEIDNTINDILDKLNKMHA